MLSPVDYSRLLILVLEIFTFTLSITPAAGTAYQFPSHIKALMNSNCSGIDKAYFPLMKVKHSDEEYNSSFDVIEYSDVVSDHSGNQFSIICTAPYPVEWVVNYFYNGYPNGNFGLHLQIHRKFSNFHDPSTYRFSISSKLRYKNTHGFKHFSFSCRSVTRPECLQSIMFTSFDEIHDGKHGVKINLLRGPKKAASASISEAKDEHFSPAFDNVSSSCDFILHEENLGSNRYNLRCQFDDGTPGTVKVIHQCSNAISCMTFHQQHHEPLLPEKCAKRFIGNSSCPNCNVRKVRLSQGFLACVDTDDDHHPHNVGKLLFFFSSVPLRRRNFSGKLYYNMTHVDHGDMISFAKVNRKVLLGDQLHVECNTSSYYFASGTKFGVKYRGSEELTYFKAIANPSHGPGSENFPANIHEGSIPITTTSGTIEKIYCFAPTWNSFAWVNKSIDVEGKEASPHIVVAVSITLLGTTLFCCLLFALCWFKIWKNRLSKFGKLLTQQEIDEFKKRPNIFVNGGLRNDYDYINASLFNEKGGDICYIEIKREQLLLDETVVLGKGYFGKVLKGVYRDETSQKFDVAIKTLKTKNDVAALKSLLSELRIMAAIGKHVNVVNLIGACTKRMARGEVYVAVEYCANGNLQDYLRANRDKFKEQRQRGILIIEPSYNILGPNGNGTFSSLDLIKWAWEIAKGMEFLSSKKVIHGDLATRNILLTEDRVAKVSDFGLSRQLVDYYYVKDESNVPHPWKWMSIESLRDMKFSIHSDCWSMGVTLWEIFSIAEVPYYGCSWSIDFVQALESGHRLGKPEYATTEIYTLMLACWKEDPSARPSFFTIKNFFEDLITGFTCQDYMQLDLSEMNKENMEIRETLRTPLLTACTPTIEIISDCEVDDDVFEQDE